MIDVAFYKLNQPAYPCTPFSPGTVYPELSAMPYPVETGKENPTYGAVRALFLQLGYDADHAGSPEWNPLKGLVKPGERVMLKPNLVYHQHPCGEHAVLSMITHASLIRPVVDYILLATSGDVQLTIGDAPVQGGDFEHACKLSGIDDLVNYYRAQGVDIACRDFRMLKTLPNKMDVLDRRVTLRGRDSFYRVDLKEKSELCDVMDKRDRFEITDYGYGAVKKHHTQSRNEYFIPREVLEADLFVNLPKMKTHRKAGLTCAMKNLVGINGDKTSLAHHIRGTKDTGGDEFSKNSLKAKAKVRFWTFLKTNRPGIKVASAIKWFFQKFVWGGQTMKEHSMSHNPGTFSEGSWHGNDTIWRCVKDLNKIIFYADKRGNMQDTMQRRYLFIADGILAGEGEGPMEQSEKPFGLVLAGENPVYGDYAAARLMCYNYLHIPCIRQGFCNRWWPLVSKDPGEVQVCGNCTMEAARSYFVPCYGWQDKLTPYER